MDTEKRILAIQTQIDGLQAEIEELRKQQIQVKKLEKLNKGIGYNTQGVPRLTFYQNGRELRLWLVQSGMDHIAVDPELLPTLIARLEEALNNYQAYLKGN